MTDEVIYMKVYETLCEVQALKREVSTLSELIQSLTKISAKEATK